MIPPVEFQDRSAYKQRMNDLLTIDPKRTVVVTVDMQRDYLDLTVATAPVAADESERVLTHSKDLLDFARAEGIPVIHVYVNRRPIEIERGLDGAALGKAGRPHNLSQNAQAGVRRIPDRLVGSPNAEVPAMLVASGDIHVTSKKVMDGYLGTELEMLLDKVFHAEAVVLTGVNTDTCVYSTTFSTSNRGYKPIVISDCVASSRGKDHHWMALELMSRSMAWVLTVEQFKAKVRAAALAKSR